MKHLLIAATLLATGISPAFSWDYNQTNGHGNQQVGDGATGLQSNQRQGQSQAQAQSQGQRQSAHANATGGSSNVNVSNNSGGGGGYGGGVFLSIPDGRGEAPCGGGVGLGGGGSSAGGGVGGTLWEFGDCKRLRESKMLHDWGYPDAALAEMCQIDRVKEAFEKVGRQCPSPAAVAEPVTTKYPFDYCGTRNAGDKNQHLECVKK